MESNDNKPRRYIFSDDDLEKFLNSPCKAELLKIIKAMGNACAHSTFQYDPKQPLNGLSPALAVVHGALGSMAEWVDDIAPVQSDKIRFGNPSFKTWHQKLTQRAPGIVNQILQTQKQYGFMEQYDLETLQSCAEAGRQAARGELHNNNNGEAETPHSNVVVELCSYLDDAFGHPVRLDYGTGHESSFQVFLFTLCKLHCFGSTASEPPTADRLKAITIAIYHQYLNVTRKLQKIYRLEPAGSHGVWGLDDYYALAFYFGACQLQDSDTTPASIHERNKPDTYLYFGCIEFIKELKSGVPFFESSPVLNDISNLPSWSKVASGLIKMYEGEVLNKLQVVQHLKFGKIFAANWTPSAPPREAPTSSVFHTTTKAPWAK